MESIIQLSKYKYDKLVDLANLNEKEVEKRAKELYEKKGVHGIVLEIRPNTFNDKVTINTNAHFSDWDSFFPVGYGGKKKFINNLEDVAGDVIEREFGVYIHEVSKLRKASSEFETRKKVMTGTTITAWALSACMILIYLLR